MKPANPLTRRDATPCPGQRAGLSPRRSGFGHTGGVSASLRFIKRPSFLPDRLTVGEPRGQRCKSSADRLTGGTPRPDKRTLESPVHRDHPIRWTGALLLAGFLTTGANGADWPQFLGPTRNGISPETNLIEAWPSGGPPLVWERQVGTGYGAPSILGNMLVLHHRQAGEEIVEAMDATSGKTLWRQAGKTSFVDPYGYNNGPRCTPLLTSNRCYTFGAQGRLLCLDLADGTVVWQRETEDDWEVPEAFFGVGSTPLLEDGKLIVMVGGQPDSGVVALDASTGRTLWQNVGKHTWDGVVPIGWRSTKPHAWKGTEKLTSYSSPIAATINGQRHVFCLMRQGLVSLDPQDGRVRFKRWFRAEVNESVNAMTPIVSENHVLISSAYYRMGSVLLRVSDDGNSFTEVWRSPKDRFARDPITRRFEEPVLEAHWSTPILHGGNLYAFGGRNEPDATFRCLEFRTGKVRWSRDESWRRGAGRQPSVYGRGSLILADGKLIVLGEGGRLGLFLPNPEKPVELCAWQVPQLRYPCWTAPALANQRLYLRGEGRLLCLNLSHDRAASR